LTSLSALREYLGNLPSGLQDKSQRDDVAEQSVAAKLAKEKQLEVKTPKISKVLKEKKKKEKKKKAKKKKKKKKHDKKDKDRGRIATSKKRKRSYSSSPLTSSTSSYATTSDTEIEPACAKSPPKRDVPLPKEDTWDGIKADAVASCFAGVEQTSVC